MFRPEEPPISREEIRGALLLLMNIDDNVERIRKRSSTTMGSEEEEPN
jgi:hypothetical protein